MRYPQNRNAQSLVSAFLAERSTWAPKC